MSHSPSSRYSHKLNVLPFDSTLSESQSSTPQVKEHPFEVILRSLLEPITSDSFEQTIDQVKQHLVLFNQMLVLLEETEFEGLLFKILQTVTEKLGQLLQADRTTIFLRDTSQKELWSIVAQDEQCNPIEIRIPDHEGIAGQVVQQGISINIPYDFYDDPRSKASQSLEKNTGYRTYSLLTLPLKQEQGHIIAVVQLLNKYRIGSSPATPLYDRIDCQGFTTADEIRLKQMSDAIVLLLQSYQDFDRASQKQRASDALIKATQYLCEVTSDWESTVFKVLAQAQTLLCSDYSDIWLVDREQQSVYHPFNVFWGLDHSLFYFKQIAEQVISTQQFIRLNGIRHDRDLSIESMDDISIDNVLSLPIYNDRQDIIGVTILANKSQRHSSKHQASDAKRTVRVNFDDDDEAFMAVFNRHVGLALERAWRFQEMETRIQERTAELEQQQQQMRQEIAERKKAEKMLQEANLKLEALARIDGLTQIDNRRQFDLQFAKEWKRMRREQQPLSIILCDIDFFKKYNDTYGHLEGDRCLYQVAQAIQSTLKRPADMVARYGGEEFVILLPNTPLEGARHVAEIIRAVVAKLNIPHEASPKHQVITLSLGVASTTPVQDETQAHLLIHKADQGLYQAKQRGRNQVASGD